MSLTSFNVSRCDIAEVKLVDMKEGVTNVQEIVSSLVKKLFLF